MTLFRFFARGVFTLFAVFCLSSALFFTGCKPEPEPYIINTSFIPLGEWTSKWGESYSITNTSIGYDDGFLVYNGSIIEANNFSQNAGVLIIQIITSTPTEHEGKFIGVYYKDYTASHVFLANAIDGSYNLIIKNTLNEAKNTFTVDNVGTHVTYWGSGYSK